ncbi:MAG: class I SAM-dependent methyltransferase [Planctomycetes bacterium]|nr:class I SAM-dependent methyltransferase [Planctomycetota bacterium]
MLTLDPLPAEHSDAIEPAASPEVMLADGSWLSLAGLSIEQLQQLQWEQEQKFVHAMRSLPKGSQDRALVTGQAYDTVCAILAAQLPAGEPLVMGLDPRYSRLVVELLNQQINRGIGQPCFFEIGYGSGVMLKEVNDHGFPSSGIEVSTTMRNEAIGVLGENFSDRLLLGDLRDVTKESLPNRPSLLYWNDVFEHICPDEISDYLDKIYELLMPGGQLVTITPNWLLRPSDVTSVFCPPRTEANGLHLKEYRLAEVTALLKQAGFRRVAAPLVVSRKRIYQLGGGFRLGKQWIEPLLDKLPVRPAHLLCRGLGLSCTIATK